MGGKVVQVEVRCKGHRSDEEGAGQRRAAGNVPLDDFQPARSAESDLDYFQSDPLFSSHLHKDVATLMTLLLTPTKSHKSISYGVFAHGGGRSRSLAFLQSRSSFPLIPGGVRYKIAVVNACTHCCKSCASLSLEGRMWAGEPRTSGQGDARTLRAWLWAGSQIDICTNASPALSLTTVHAISALSIPERPSMLRRRLLPYTIETGTADAAGPRNSRLTPERRE